MKFSCKPRSTSRILLLQRWKYFRITETYFFSVLNHRNETPWLSVQGMELDIAYIKLASSIIQWICHRLWQKWKHKECVIVLIVLNKARKTLMESQSLDSAVLFIKISKIQLIWIWYQIMCTLTSGFVKGLWKTNFINVLGILHHISIEL